MDHAVVAVSDLVGLALPDLCRSLDELPSQTRRLLLLVDEMVSAECERQKIERDAGNPDYILNEPGVGYRLTIHQGHGDTGPLHQDGAAGQSRL